MARILILEESSANMCDFRHALVGHELFCVGTLDLAMDILKGCRVDLVVTGVYLERGDIFRFLRIVKTYCPNVRVVLCSTNAAHTLRYAHELIRKAATALGAYSYVILKKFHPIELRSAIEACLPLNCSEPDIRPQYGYARVVK